MVIKDAYDSKTHKKAFNFTVNHSFVGYLSSTSK